MKLQSLLRKINKKAFVVICEWIETDTYPFYKSFYPKTKTEHILPGRLRDQYEEVENFFLQDEMWKYKDYNVTGIHLWQDYPSLNMGWMEIYIEKPKKKESAA